MRKNKYFPEIYSNDYQKLNEANVRYAIQKKQMLDDINAERERERMIAETEARVLARLSVSADVSEAIKAIEELARAMDGAFGKGVK